MRHDREGRHGGRRPRRRPQEWLGRGEYGEEYEAPYDFGFHGYDLGYGGGRRSRGSYQAGQLRSGNNPRDEFEFEWGEGYVGGRGYGGTNYDLRHGYRVGSLPRRGLAAKEELWRAEPPAPSRGWPERREAAAERGGAGGRREEPPRPWDAAAALGPGRVEAYGPARYGYGPYFERLRRRRRSDDEIRQDVEDTLFYDTWVDADRIQVEVEDGVVTLRGTLSSYDEIRYATDDAWDVEGVRGVRTELSVEPEEREREQSPRRQERYAAADEAERGAAGSGADAAARTESRAEYDQPPGDSGIGYEVSAEPVSAGGTEIGGPAKKYEPDQSGPESSL